MPAITSSTSFVLSRGSSVIFELGGTGTATVDPTGIGNAYRIGLQEAFLGPYDRNVTILVTVEGGTINYRIDADGDLSDQTQALAALGAEVSDLKGTPTGLNALQALSLASSRRVDLVMLGDSNQAFGGYGFSTGLEKALAARFPIYASPICAGSYTSQQFSAIRITGGGATDIPSDPALDVLMRWVGATTLRAQAINSGVSSSALTGGLTVPVASPLDVTAALRFHFAWGGSSTFVGGSMRPGVRLNASPFSVIAQAPASISTTIDYTGLRITTVDVAAAARTTGLEGKFLVPSGPSTGPFVHYYARAERVDRVAGISCHTLYSGGGMSAWDMAWALQNTPTETLTTFFAETRRLQMAAGQSPIVGVYINTGVNDRNEANTPSLGPARIVGAGDSPAEYIDNLRGVQNRIKKVWEANGWPLGELHWLIVPSHRISDPDDAELIAYRAAVAATLATEPQTSLIDLGSLMTAAAATSAGWYDAGGNVHLTNAGYDAVGALMVAQIPA
jgi:hypothetical protein